ncbi:MAG: flagellar hook-length control protein FliK [Kangiellaceae bacterium]|nr:flagellar hook-length control protein FliK [Kangiellaceae bacterium]
MPISFLNLVFSGESSSNGGVGNGESAESSGVNGQNSASNTSSWQSSFARQIELYQQKNQQQNNSQQKLASPEYRQSIIRFEANNGNNLPPFTVSNSGNMDNSVAVKTLEQFLSAEPGGMSTIWQGMTPGDRDAYINDLASTMLDGFPGDTAKPDTAELLSFLQSRGFISETDSIELAAKGLEGISSVLDGLSIQEVAQYLVQNATGANRAGSNNAGAVEGSTGGVNGNERLQPVNKNVQNPANQSEVTKATLSLTTETDGLVNVVASAAESAGKQTSSIENESSNTIKDLNKSSLLGDNLTNKASSDLEDESAQKLSDFEKLVTGKTKIGKEGVGSLAGEEALKEAKLQALAERAKISPDGVQKQASLNGQVNSLASKLQGASGLNSNAQTVDPTTLVTSNSAETLASRLVGATDLNQAVQSTSASLSASSNINQGLSLRSNFSPNLAMRIQWIYQQAVSSAEILMDPPELGPMTVKLQNTGTETNVVFQVNNAQTKDMIEENLAKLKELLAEQGIALGDAQVQQNQTGAEQDEQSAQSAQTGDSFDEEHLPGEERQTVGLLDTYI